MSGSSASCPWPTRGDESPREQSETRPSKTAGSEDRMTARPVVLLTARRIVNTYAAGPQGVHHFSARGRLLSAQKQPVISGLACRRIAGQSRRRLTQTLAKSARAVRISGDPRPSLERWISRASMTRPAASLTSAFREAGPHALTAGWHGSYSTWGHDFGSE